jgi:hypothetical protein
MKKLKLVEEIKTERPPKAIVTEKEALEKIKNFAKRKGEFLETARENKNRSVRS